MTETVSISKLIQDLTTRSGRAILSQLGLRSPALRKYLGYLYGREPGEPGALLADPVLEAAFGWKLADVDMQGLSRSGLLREELVSAMDKPPREYRGEYAFPRRRKPFQHQLDCWRLLLDDLPRSVLVASGTGSGKTECFLVPILEDLARERARTGLPVASLRPAVPLRQIGPRPRVIADDIWARLLWAGLNVNVEDIPRTGRFPGIHAKIFHVEYIRAAAIVWLFAALRNNEVRRLRMGCVRWQPSEVDSRQPICVLDVPETKTGASYSKPVDPAVGQAIESWLAVRPNQPSWADPKTGELVQPLFMYRALPMSMDFINRTLIPLLCRKAGIPCHDVRGRITSHRARATIANQLFNSREPMSLSELQAWLGHRTPQSTQHYVTITPTKLARAYSDSGYFERNTRAVKVLIDRDRFMCSPESGEPWLHYDLGHGWCSFEFFDRCPHRMACARCDFYIPKESAVAQLLEANENNHRFLKTIPVTDEERAATDGDSAAVARLLSRLEHQPTPSGQTPAELRKCHT